MTRTAIFYGSTTGNTGEVAGLIEKALGDAVGPARDIQGLSVDAFLEYDTLILGVSTWDIGELQEDWQMLSKELVRLDLSGKTVALFGCGDQYSYPDTFGDALGLLWDLLEPRGARLVGRWSTAGYDFEASRGERDGTFLGLLCDFENQKALTEARVAAWVTQLKGELGMSEVRLDEGSSSYGSSPP